MKNVFIVQENGGVYWVHFKTLNGLPFKAPHSSFNILKARLLNISYGEFLILTKEQFNATLKGRDGGYIVEFFENIEDAKRLAFVLNERLNKVIDYYKIEGEEEDG